MEKRGEEEEGKEKEEEEEYFCISPLIPTLDKLLSPFKTEKAALI